MYQAFMDRYPRSPFYDKAKEMYDLRSFEAATKEASYESYRDFYKNNPQSAYREKAQQLAFDKAYQSKNLKMYERYLADVSGWATEG
ncbi:MAG: hypothetical protein HC880_17525 [Bacteroidia bacterium]|nr:hypothetical protein [Bacteroidia bacterium]